MDADVVTVADLLSVILSDDDVVCDGVAESESDCEVDADADNGDTLTVADAEPDC
jgi:hypothetical protein